MIQSGTNAGAAADEGLRIEELLIELSTRFINLPSDQVDREIEDAQHRICEYLSLDRCALWQELAEEPDTLLLTHIYQRPGIRPLPVPVDARVTVPWFLDQVRQGRTVALSKLDDLPAEAACDREALGRYGTKSTLVVPLATGGAVFGALTFASAREREGWPESLVKRLQLVAEVFTNALARALSDQALRASEERYALAVEGANDGLWDWDIRTNQVYFGSRWKGMLGYEDHELASEFSAWEALLHPEDRERALATLQAYLAGQTPVYELEHRLRGKDGSYRWILARGKALRDADGRPYRMAGSHTDITDHKRAEEALQQRNQYIETILEQAPIGFAVHTIDDGVGRFVSARFEEIYAVPRGTITSHLDFFDKVWPDEAAFREQLRRRVMADIASGDPGRMRWENVPVKLLSGDTRYITATNIPLPQQNLMVSTVQDVTERVRAETSLRESLLRFRQVAEVTNDFIWEVDAEGFYTYTSPSVQVILGYTPEELVGKLHFYDLFAPDVRANLKAAVLETFAAKRPFRALPNLNLSKEGRTVHLESSGVPILDRAGNLLGYRGAGADVTERARAQAELRRTLDEVQRLRDQLERQNVYLQREVKLLHGPTHIIGQSQALKRVLIQVEQVASTASTVLLLGETGTGKELVASTIHELSPRRKHPMVRVNCSAIPSSLIESELFGREKGAYTGALSKQVGRFELANGSTLFLDEIGDLPSEVQVKLLRVLEEKQIERLGNSTSIPVDVRIIAATNHDLHKAVRDGTFREDLFYRLNVFPIAVPPLRDRRDDIPSLVSAFVEEFATQFGKNIESIDKKSMETLQRYHWPGNVRELRNVIERAMIVARGPKLWVDPPAGMISVRMPSLAMRETEQQHIRHVLDLTGWRIRGRNGAAEILGLKPSTLESRMARLGIRRQDKSPPK